MVNNEEALDNYGDRAWIDWARNAVTVKESERQKSSIDLLGIMRPMLEDWGKELQRDEICDTFFAVPLASTAPAGLGSTNGQRVNGALFDAATPAQRNTWITDNADRVLVGGAQGNISTVWATAMATITTGMTLSAAASLKMKRLAKKANPRIRPYKLKNGREYFVTFAGSNCFRDLQSDATIITANTQARPREGDGLDKNPLFQDGDLLYNGIIFREVPEIDIRLPTTYTTAGSGSIQVSPVFMCGQSAMAWCWGRMPRPTFRKEDDYQFIRGVGIEMAYGLKTIAKLSPAGNYKNWGIFTGFFASQADT